MATIDITEGSFQTPASKKRKASGSPSFHHLLVSPPRCPQITKMTPILPRVLTQNLTQQSES